MGCPCLSGPGARKSGQHIGYRGTVADRGGRGLGWKDDKGQKGGSKSKSHELWGEDPNVRGAGAAYRPPPPTGHTAGIGGRAQHKERRRVRKAVSFLTAGRASRGDGGFVQQLQETVGNMETAQMGEGAGGFLLQRDTCQSVPWPYHSTQK